MCWMCANPDATYEDMLERMRGIMLRHGWAVQHVGRDGPRPAFAYTVGLTEAGLPELVATGLSGARSARLLNTAANHSLQCELSPGERVHFGDCQAGDYQETEIVRLEHPAAHLNTALALFGREVEALQLVWADDRGRWPWEPAFRGNRGGQPVLGHRGTEP